MSVCMHMPLSSKYFTSVKSFHAYNSPTRKVLLPTVLQNGIEMLRNLPIITQEEMIKLGFKKAKPNGFWNPCFI